MLIWVKLVSEYLNYAFVALECPENKKLWLAPRPFLTTMTFGMLNHWNLFQLTCTWIISYYSCQNSDHQQWLWCRSRGAPIIIHTGAIAWIHYCTTAILHHCNPPPLQFSTTAILHHCNSPSLQFFTTAILHYCNSPSLQFHTEPWQHSSIIQLHRNPTLLHDCTTYPLHCKSAKLHHCRLALLYNYTRE